MVIQSIEQIKEFLNTHVPNCQVLMSDIKYGHIATNMMMVAKKQEIIDEFLNYLNKSPIIKEVKIINKFINIFFKEEFIVNMSLSYNIAKQEKINVEYVSPNPTGYLHLAHARNAVVGDVLCNFLEFIGYDVTREMYINDFGQQMVKFYNSIDYYLGKCQEEPQYKGEYIKDIAELIKSGELSKNQVLHYMIVNIKNVLKKLNITHNTIVYESDIANNTPAILDKLKTFNLTKEEDGKVYILSSKFDDDQDRVLKKSDGSFTYIANDIAYHYDKLQRGFKKQVVVLGMDHIGYFKRLKAGLSAFDIDLNIIGLNIVKYYDPENGLQKLSKRAGTTVSLEDLVDKYGHKKIVTTMLSKNYTHEFNFNIENIEKEKDLSFYIYYANMRIDQLDNQESLNIKPDYSLLTSIFEQKLVQKIAQWVFVLDDIHQSLDVHKMFVYATELAQCVHSFLSNLQDNNQDVILAVTRMLLLKKSQHLLNIIKKIVKL